MWCPCAPVGWFFVDEDFDSRRCNGSPVEIESSMDLGPSGEFWVDAGAAEEIEGQDALRKESVPQVEREICVGGAQRGDQMIFERADGALGGVASMNSGWDELEVDGFVFHELFHLVGALVVEALDFGLKACLDEAGMDEFVGSEDGGSCPVWHGFCVDGIAVVVVEDEDVIVAGAGRE